MSSLENSVYDLAKALEDLELRIDERLEDETNNHEHFETIRRQAHAASTHARRASTNLASLITDMKALLPQNK